MWQFLKKPEMNLQYSPAIPFLGPPNDFIYLIIKILLIHVHCYAINMETLDIQERIKKFKN